MLISIYRLYFHMADQFFQIQNQQSCSVSQFLINRSGSPGALEGGGAFSSVGSFHVYEEVLFEGGRFTEGGRVLVEIRYLSYFH